MLSLSHSLCLLNMQATKTPTSYDGLLEGMSASAVLVTRQEGCIRQKYR